MTLTPGGATEESFLIVKRGLFWRPNGQGYTGIRDEAGRYSEEAARYHAEHGECTIIHADEAPEFMPAAFSDLVIKHLQKHRDDLRIELEQLRRPSPDSKLEAYRKALEEIAAYPVNGACVQLALKALAAGG